MDEKSKNPDRFANLHPTDLTTTEQTTLISLAHEILARRHAKGKKYTDPEDVKHYLRLELAEYKDEVFAVLFLDNRHHFIAFEILFYGTIDGASIHPRVIVRRALELNAAAVIVAHNHPSHVAEPSKADESISKRLKDALALVDVRMLDSLVVTADEVVSFAERGLI